MMLNGQGVQEQAHQTANPSSNVAGRCTGPATAPSELAPAWNVLVGEDVDIVTTFGGGGAVLLRATHSGCGVDLSQQNSFKHLRHWSEGTAEGLLRYRMTQPMQMPTVSLQYCSYPFSMLAYF